MTSTFDIVVICTMLVVDRVHFNEGECLMLSFRHRFIRSQEAVHSKLAGGKQLRRPRATYELQRGVRGLLCNLRRTSNFLILIGQQPLSVLVPKALVTLFQGTHYTKAQPVITTIS